MSRTILSCAAHSFSIADSLFPVYSTNCLYGPEENNETTLACRSEIGLVSRPNEAKNFTTLSGLDGSEWVADQVSVNLLEY